jgi:hypothetical protein
MSVLPMDSVAAVLSLAQRNVAPAVRAMIKTQLHVSCNEGHEIFRGQSVRLQLCEARK